MKTSTALDLRTLRLDKARALLKYANQAHQPAFDTDPVAYLQYLIDSLCDLSLQDALTGLANRRHFFAVLERELDRVNRSGEAALLLMLDIDHFKQVNDTHGHCVGDQVLQTVARALARCVRPMDSLARHGGEEFAMVLPACNPLLGQLVAERIRRAVEKTVFYIAPDIELRVTISIGGAFVQQSGCSDPLLWLDKSDHQLYRAKLNGRNRVCIENPSRKVAGVEEERRLLNALPTPSCWSSLPDPAAGAWSGTAGKAAKVAK